MRYCRVITDLDARICIARLYGGGPPLWISPALIPTPTHPLTPPFASAPTTSDNPASQSNGLLPPSLDISSAPTLPAGHQPASPRFLLSLLSTAVYLSIPSVASQALLAIVRTVGPHTALRYLNFALGHGIGQASDPAIPGEDPKFDSGPAVSLEDVAELPKDEEPPVDDFVTVPVGPRPSVHSETYSSPAKGGGGKRYRKCSGPPTSDTDSDSEPEGCSPSSVVSSRSRHDSSGKFRSVSWSSAGTAGRGDEPCFYYGAVSDKVGEAAACWLARWGIDMLRYEQEVIAAAESQGTDALWSSGTSQAAQGPAERPGSAPPEIAGSRSSGRLAVPSGKPPAVPVIWRKGGLSARWVRGILSSDAFFVKGEKERYEMARKVVEMRRASTTADHSGECDDEAEFEKLFNGGIYYANMVSPIHRSLRFLC